MKLFILPLFIFSTAYAYTCNRTVDSKKVVVFVDLNFSISESEAASRAACERGESFKIIPTYDKAVIAERTTLEKQYEKFWKDCPNGQGTNSTCKTKGIDLDKKIDVHNKKMETYAVNKGKFQTELSNLAKANKAVTSMTVSGHDGGGSVHGTLGGLDKTEIIASFKTAYKSKPQLANQFQSVFMWGCWTAGPSEVSYWRDNLPQLKMVGGFFDMGPLNTTEASRDVLHDLLVKEKNICDSSDKNAVKRMIASVDNINDTYAAVYAENNCGKNYYYYNTKGVEDTENPHFKAGNHFVEFDKTFDCKMMKEEIDQKRIAYEKYYYGNKPIPTNTTTSELRQIYSFVRSNSQCLKESDRLNGDRILATIFFEDVKKNFASTFADTIKEANKEFKMWNKFLESYKPKGKDMLDFKNLFNSKKAKYFEPNMENLKTKNKMEIRGMISFLDGLANSKIVATNKDVKNKTDDLRKLKKLMEKYLYQMDPQCMDVLEWHEYKPNRPVTPYCT